MIGDRNMATIRGATLVLAAALLLASAARAADDDLRAKALKLNEVTGEDATKAKTIELLKDANGTKKLLEVAKTIVKEKDQPFNVNATLILARAAHGLRQYDTSERFYRTNLNQALKLQSAPKIGNAYSGLAGMLFEAKKYAESQKICQEFMELEVDAQLDKDLERYRLPVVRLLVKSMVRQNDVDKAKDLVEKLIKAQPENWLNLELKGWVLRDTNDFEGAVKAYETVINRIEKDDRLTKEEKKDFAADIKYTLTGVYIELNKVDKATDLLEGLLKDEPDSPTYNNDLGYILADHDMKLDEAEKMIRKALEEDRKLRKKDNPDLKPEDDKDNASYLDSLGWVLFKKKNYKEAVEYLKKAVQDEDGKHVEIYDHLGDAHWALGEKKEAVQAWKKGVEVAGTTKREQTKKAEVEKKIKEKQ
jgi:tetratricopeptide (TPR) repeat protein